MDSLDLITVTRSRTTLHPIALLNPVKPDLYTHNLITFLAAVQVLNMDFLPITWQPNLEDIGRGATAEIRQSLLSLQTSLAFKRIHPSKFSRRSEETAENGKVKAFHALLSEISILALAYHHANRNIVTLLGICWDVSQEGTAWPVLVFEKASHGNFLNFVTAEPNEANNWATKLKLVGGIAKALEWMHSYSTMSILGPYGSSR